MSIPSQNWVHCTQFSVSQGRTPAPAQSPHPCSQLLHVPHWLHPTYSDHTPHDLCLSQAKTECTALSFWFCRAEHLFQSNLSIPSPSHCIQHMYTTTCASTICPAINFHHGLILNAVHLVFGFGGQNPHLHPISPSPPSTTACMPYTLPQILPACLLPLIYFMGQYWMQCIQFSIFRAKFPLPPNLACLLTSFLNATLNTSLTVPWSYTQPSDVLVYILDKFTSWINAIYFLIIVLQWYFSPAEPIISPRHISNL